MASHRTSMSADEGKDEAIENVQQEYQRSSSMSADERDDERECAAGIPEKVINVRR